MKSLSSPGRLALIFGGLCVAIAPTASLASESVILATLGADFFLFNSQGYLGVNLGEIDGDRATALHLPDTHGAEVTLVDHDAPAGKSGLKVHDVILKIDGEPFDTADQFRHRLREIPAGRKVALLISRDGDHKTINVQLCDPDKLKQETRAHLRVPIASSSTGPVKSFMGRAPTAGSGFLGSVLPKSLYVGADVNPVRTQLADYFGVTSGMGLLVESVDAQSPAYHAGMKAGDVIVQVESVAMRRRSDWEKAMHRHRGLPVQVTVMRNKQEQVLTLTAGKPKKS